MLNKSLFFVIFTFILLVAIGQSASLTVKPGREPYTSEKAGHLVVYLDGKSDDCGLTFKAMFKEEIIVKERPVKTGKRLLFDVDLEKLPLGDSDIVCHVTQKDKEPTVAHVTLRRAVPRDNVTKVDFIRRSLLVDDQPFFPVGFYCDSNFKLSLPETEIIHGFNMISPYRYGLATANEKEKKKTLEFLDLCESIGMKVVYDLRPIAEKDSEGKYDKLKAELDLVGNHPAILCWILSDEPADKGIDPEPLIETYNFVKENDPYHPVTMVFCHFALMHKYMDAMDFVLLDYYPIPNHPVTMVDEMLAGTRNAIGPFTPLWYVPQAFGGSWAWSREPSARELRVMTYLALIQGNSGINYFIRRPEIDNPNSPLLWAECRRMAAEISQINPALLSEKAYPELSCSVDNVYATARENGGYYTIVAANVKNQPSNFEVEMNSTCYTGKADVLFEDRQVDVQDGKIKDTIDGFARRVYRFKSDNYVAGDLEINPKNVVVNPSFEESVNPGTPTGCCFGDARGFATLFMDPLQHRHGLYSIKVNAPAKGSAVMYKASPIAVEKGQQYELSIWAKAEKDGQQFKVFSDFLSGEFELTKEWKRYTTTGTAKSSSTRQVMIHVKFEGQGAAWFDLLQVVPIEPEKE